MINTHLGLYCYEQMPFGLSCVQDIFQKVMEQTLSDIPSVACYLDELLLQVYNTEK